MPTHSNLIIITYIIIFQMDCNKNIPKVIQSAIESSSCIPFDDKNV